jgi:hypothetical protein
MFQVKSTTTLAKTKTITTKHDSIPMAERNEVKLGKLRLTTPHVYDLFNLISIVDPQAATFISSLSRIPRTVYQNAQPDRML